MRPISVAEVARRSLGLNQAACARELGWTQSRLSRFERAALPAPADVVAFYAAIDRVRQRRADQAKAAAR